MFLLPPSFLRAPLISSRFSDVCLLLPPPSLSDSWGSSKSTIMPQNSCLYCSELNKKIGTHTYILEKRPLNSLSPAPSFPPPLAGPPSPPPPPLLLRPVDPVSRFGNGICRGKGRSDVVQCVVVEEVTIRSNLPTKFSLRYTWGILM